MRAQGAKRTGRWDATSASSDPLLRVVSPVPCMRVFASEAGSFGAEATTLRDSL
jgi:hypothetical protein